MEKCGLPGARTGSKTWRKLEKMPNPRGVSTNALYRAFTPSNVCRNPFLHQPAFTQTTFTQTRFSQTTFYTKQPLHKRAFIQTSFPANQLFNQPAFAQTTFCAKQLLHTSFYTHHFFDKPTFYTNQLYTTCFGPVGQKPDGRRNAEGC